MEFSLDCQVDPRLKDGWCKQTRRTAGENNWCMPPHPYPSIKCSDFQRYQLPEGEGGISQFDHKLRLLDLSEHYSDWIQLDCPGFLPNKRQHRMFGLAVLQMSTSLSRHIGSLRQGGVGLEVRDSCSSSSVRHYLFYTIQV